MHCPRASARTTDRTSGAPDRHPARAPRLGSAAPARPALARDARSVARPRERGDAAADAGTARRAGVRAVRARMARSGRVCGGATRRAVVGVAGARVSPAVPQPPRGGEGGGGAPRWSGARGARGTGGAPGRGRLHRARRAGLRARPRRRARRRQRVARAVSVGGRAARPRGGAIARGCRGAAGAFVGVEPVDDGPRSDGVHGEGDAVLLLRAGQAVTRFKGKTPHACTC